VGPLASSGYCRKRDFGFTLAEVLVVIVVIGLAAGFIYARFDSDPRQAVEREARRLAGALEHAAQLAQWRGETLGVSMDGTGYRFWRRVTAADGDRWQTLTDDDVLAPYSFAPDIVGNASQYAGQAAPANAILPLRASGRNEPYAVEIDSDTWRVTLVADPLNRVAMSAPVAR
jgi:type II secretion system protein H